MRISQLGLVTMMVVLAAGTSWADLVRFKDGSEVEGEVTQRGKLIFIRTPVGTITRPMSQVKEIVKKDTQGIPPKKPDKPTPRSSDRTSSSTRRISSSFASMRLTASRALMHSGS